MKIRLLIVGKTQKKYVSEGMSDYEQRISHYVPFDVVTVPALKKSQKSNAEEEIRNAEGTLLLKYINKDDYIVLLDEQGKSYRSIEFADFLQKNFLKGHKRMVFVIGGAWGFGDMIQKRANNKMSLSKMTFSHQIVRLIFLEQFYRALTIIKNEPYHNE